MMSGIGCALTSFLSITVYMTLCVILRAVATCGSVASIHGKCIQPLHVHVSLQLHVKRFTYMYLLRQHNISVSVYTFIEYMNEHLQVSKVVS